jgi:hypothetical protein
LSKRHNSPAIGDSTTLFVPPTLNKNLKITPQKTAKEPSSIELPQQKSRPVKGGFLNSIRFVI